MSDDKDQVLTEEGAARRRFLKQAGAVAWGAPLIVTMLSRTAHAQDFVCGTKLNPGDDLSCNVTAACSSPTPECRGVPGAAAGTPCGCFVI